VTSHFPHQRRIWIFAIATTVFSILSPTAIGQTIPVQQEWVDSYQAIDGCRDMWVIDARSAPICGDLAAGMSDLQFFHAEQHGILQCWSEYSQREFLATADASLPTTYFFHGYGMIRPGAILSGERVADYMGEGAPPFRLVIWVWPARHRLLASTTRNLREKTTSANAQGYYLASLLRRIDPQSAVTLAGHSFGARCTLAALQGMAVGHVEGIALPPDCAVDRRRIQSALLAPAVSSFALSSSGEFFLAASEADRTLITINCDDGSLTLMARVTGDDDILGLTGPYHLEPGSNVHLLDTNPYLGSHHRVSYFLWSKPVAATLQPYLIYYEAQP
jgi:hypothetical protein